MNSPTAKYLASLLGGSYSRFGALRSRRRRRDKKPLFWHSVHFVASAGGAPLETVRAEADAQGTEEHARKPAALAKN